MKLNQLLNKFDAFHLVLLFATLVGVSFVFFIFSTARPQELKLIKWSAIEQPQQSIESLSKYQYPVFKNTNKITFWGLEKINLPVENAAAAVIKITNLPAQVSPLPENLEVNNAETTSVQPQQIVLNTNADKNIEVFIEVYKFIDVADINPEEFYDQKYLKKELLKSNGPLFFTAYQKSSDKIYVDIIEIKTDEEFSSPVQ